jgi:ribosomal protein L30/L7E
MDLENIKVYIDVLKLVMEALKLASKNHKIVVNYSEQTFENIDKISQLLQIAVHPNELHEIEPEKNDLGASV